jgi:hypothetical protein
MKKTKVCSKCKQEKLLDLFTKNKSRPDGKDDYCKVCKRAYNKSLYLKNKSHADNIKRNQQYSFLKCRQYIRAYLMQHPCIDCGETDPIVLEFDHVNSSDKSFNISFGAGRGFAIARLEPEIAKCEIRCANCHKRRTAKQFNWYSSLDGYVI